MVINIVTQEIESQHVMEIIPRDPAERELADESADNDAKFLIGSIIPFYARDGSSILSCCRAMAA